MACGPSVLTSASSSEERLLPNDPIIIAYPERQASNPAPAVVTCLLCASKVGRPDGYHDPSAQGSAHPATPDAPECVALTPLRKFLDGLADHVQGAYHTIQDEVERSAVACIEAGGVETHLA